MKKGKLILADLKKYRILIIALLVGILLLAMPTHGKEASADTEDVRFALALRQTEGVGNAEVLISESGVVIVCDGADNAEVKLTVIKAAEAYTGFTSDKIQVLKSEMED